MKQTAKKPLTWMASLGALSILACSSDSATESSSRTYAGAGSHYSFSIEDSAVTIKKFTNHSSTSPDFTVTGTLASYSTGFKQLTVSSVSGSGGPSVGDTAYALEIPGIAMIMKPVASGSNQVLAAVASGTCPSSTMAANWIIVKRSSSQDMSDVNSDTYGTFSYNPTSGVASLPTKYSLQNSGTNLGANTFTSATCSNGIMSVDNGGGDTAVMYLTTGGAALVNTAAGSSSDAQFILGFPSGTVSGSSMAGDYAGILFSESDGSEKLKPISMSLTWNGSALSGSGTKVSDVTTGTTTGSSATLNLTGINSPSAGLMTGTLTAGATTNIACMAVQNISNSGKNVINCSGRDPGDATKLFNFLLVSK
jgi:hypothetical protein